MKVSVFRKARFNAAHRLYRKEWSDEKNLEIFGGCSHPNYHGHNYDLIVELKGEVDPLTGFVYDLGKLKEIIDAEIIERFDHRNLNLDTQDFKELNPTAENIAVVIWNLLRPKIEIKFDLAVTLYETERNFVRYEGE